MYERKKRAMDKRTSIKAYTAAISFAVLVGFSFLGIKVCVPVADSLQILTYRYNFAFLALAVVLLLRFAKVDLRGKSKKNLILTTGFYLGFMALQVAGLAVATSIEGAIMFAIVPIIVKIIASVFLGETSTLMQNLSVGLTVAALILMIVMGSGEVTFSLLGTILLILSSLCMAVSNVFMRHVRDQYKPIEISAAIITGGFLLFNAATFVHGCLTGTLHTYFEPLKHVEFVVATIYLGVGCLLLSVQLMSYSLSKLEAVKGTIFGNVSTAISIIAGAVVLGEPLKLYHIACALLIVLGVVGLSVLGKKEDANDTV